MSSSFFSHLGASIGALAAHAEALVSTPPTDQQAAAAKTQSLKSTALEAAQSVETQLGAGLTAVATPLLGEAEQDLTTIAAAPLSKLFGAQAGPELAAFFVQAGLQAVMAQAPQVLAQLTRPHPNETLAAA